MCDIECMLENRGPGKPQARDNLAYRMSLPPEQLTPRVKPSSSERSLHADPFSDRHVVRMTARFNLPEMAVNIRFRSRLRTGWWQSPLFAASSELVLMGEHFRSR